MAIKSNYHNVRSALLLVIFLLTAAPVFGLSSANIPLDSPAYGYLEKLSGFGLISSDMRGIRPFSRSEVARLVGEAEENLAKSGDTSHGFAAELISQLRLMVPREVRARENPTAPLPRFDYDPVASLRFRSLWLDGVPRNYQRKVHDPGDDGVFGIGSGLRPVNASDSWIMQRGSEGTPLVENNNGVRYGEGVTGEVRWGSEWYLADKAALLLEPYAVVNGDESVIRLNRGYLKLGGGAIELEVGKDENWLGLGYRGTITLTNNGENFTLVKLSSPEPFTVPYLGAMKYSVIASQFDKTTVDGEERQPWFYAVKLTFKPTTNLEVGFNLGRQVGGTGVHNSLGSTLRGLIGGTSDDNSNGLAGFEARYRIPWLRNSELYGELSGEDTALFWPIVESYVAGFYLPRLTNDGRNDFRFEFFQGNQILYSNASFPAGYIYRDLPIGHSQGGATQDFLFRSSHWFSVRHNLALEYIYGNRGMVGRVDGQPIERKHTGRLFWTVPLATRLDAQAEYGVEKITNFNLENGVGRVNQIMKLEIRYKY